MRPNILTPLLVIALLGGTVTAQEIPVDVAVTVKDDGISDTGRFTLALDFLPEEDIKRAFSIRLAVLAHGRVLLTQHHRPDPPTKTWKAGRKVAYEIACVFPFEARLDDSPNLKIHVGFHDPERKKTYPPVDGIDVTDGMAFIEEMEVPAFTPVADEARVIDLLTRAKKLASGQPAEAWSMLDLGIRLTDDDSTKYRFRKALVDLGDFAPRAITLVESQIVERRIAAERQRYLRLVSGRLFDQGRYHGAMRILQEIGGSLAEEADEAVIGALNDAQRVEKDLQDVKKRLLEKITAEEKAATDADIEALAPDKKMLDRAERYAKRRMWGAARRLLRELRFADDAEMRKVAYRRLAEVEETMLDDIPPDEKAAVDRAVNHPAWARTTSVPTHNFILIGPRNLVSSVRSSSRVKFDISYIFLTDLFGRKPNPGGDRVTVYFKELWDFGGGVGGGKTIDIGRADPRRKGYPLDSALMYHELTHCVDDTNPIYAGFREGLADFGATYAHEALGERSVAANRIKDHLRAFELDYLDRDLEYWRIPNYAPSAGFLEHFSERYAKSPNGHDWAPWRRFFRAYRRWHLRDGREPYIVRAMAHFLMESFGEKVFDDLVRFRFPLLPSDREALALEVKHFANGGTEVYEEDLPRFSTYPNSPIPRDIRHRDVLEQSRWSADSCEEASRAAGIIHDWRTIGPFKCEGADPDAVVFPPEYEIDFEKEYDSTSHRLRWRVPGKKPVTIDPHGWVGFHFNYMNNSAFYAITHVTVKEDTAAYAWFRGDDDGSVWINDRLLGKYRHRGRAAAAWLWWRGPAGKVPDQMRFPVILKAGRNKVLVKIKNRWGGSGYTFALTKPDGSPIEGMRSDGELPAGKVVRFESTKKFKRTMRHVFDSKSYGSKLKPTVGRFSVRSKHLVGTSTTRGVAWRKYTVRPGFPKDSPSNLIWVKKKHVKNLTDFQLELTLASAAPKIGITFQGIEGKDGLSGWTLILHPTGGGVAARLERYDRLVYQLPATKIDASKGANLTLHYEDERLTVTLGQTRLFDAVSLRPIPGRHDVGIMTWGPQTRIRSIELKRAR